MSRTRYYFWLLIAIWNLCALCAAALRHGLQQHRPRLVHGHCAVQLQCERLLIVKAPKAGRQ